MTDYTELKRLAEAAAEGQAVWFAVVPEGAAVNPTGSALLIGPRRRDLDRMVAYAREDAHFIAAANPAAVLALIAENERLEALLGRATGDMKCILHKKTLADEAVIEITAERDQLKAELAKEIQRRFDGNEIAARERNEEVRQLKAEVEALRNQLAAVHPFKPNGDQPTIGYTGCIVCGKFTGHQGLPCPQMRAFAMAKEQG